MNHILEDNIWNIINKLRWLNKKKKITTLLTKFLNHIYNDVRLKISNFNYNT